jgi:uncharacterized lipoprotein YehR (DUF1307 family)
MNTKIAAVALALVMIVAFSGCISGNGSGYATNNSSENASETEYTVDPEVINQINSELINDAESVEIGEMI